MSNVPEIFGSLVFSESVMKERLPKAIFKAYKACVNEGAPLTKDIANVMANAMKDWAIEKGATHFTHWFQPMTGITAEKHDSFISPTDDGSVIMEFSGKELIQGEPDASSFPSGGIRATFEARGYTAWDPTSYAFIKDGCLCIPTAFCAYTGEALDKKTPLLRSMRALSNSAVKVLKLFGIETKRVVTTVGPEQEYFLVDKKLWEQRKDLVYCGRTLFGAKTPRGQELDDHYFGVIKQRVLAYMHDLNDEMWKLGVLAKTEHNEVAPAQHELAPIFSTTNVAADHNQLMMEFMKRVAAKHGMYCLLHEKPFAGVNGSGKHNNWSMSTLEGKNLLDPSKDPYHNLQFLVFLVCVLKAVDDHQDMLRVSVASAGNDHRLGANEAPPAIISAFLGTELTAILEAIADGHEFEEGPQAYLNLVKEYLPEIEIDNTDRNRTSPFAFTGNKFEFRALGSSFSISGPNIVLNTIMAEALDDAYDYLAGKENLAEAVYAYVKETYNAHKRIVFNGNGYTDEWVEEAKKRGLLNLKSAAEAIPYFSNQKNLDLFEKYGVFMPHVTKARTEIELEKYCTTLRIEVNTMLEMFNKDIMPAFTLYCKELLSNIKDKKALGISANYESKLVEKISALGDQAYEASLALDKVSEEAKLVEDLAAQAMFYRNNVIPAMDALRKPVDDAEILMGSKYLPYPTYGELLFGINE